MSEATGTLDRHIDRYLAGGVPFMDFWNSFMMQWGDASLTDLESEEYEPAYEIVYMGAAGKISAEDREAGLLDEAEVRTRLAEFRSRRSQRPRA